MSALSVNPPYPIFPDVDGTPLEDGYVYLGVANLAPETNPVQAYWDAALTIPAAQPIRTLGGYPSRSGAAARVYVNSDYSILIKNKNGTLVYSAPTATERYSEVVISSVNFLQAGAGAVERTMQNKARDIVSVKDFGAVGDGVANDTVAIQAAFNSGASEVFYPAGTYLQDNINVPITVSRVAGSGIAKQRTANNPIFTATNSPGLTFDGMTIQGMYAAGQLSYTANDNGIKLVGCTDVKIVNCTFKNILSVAIRPLATNGLIVQGNRFYLCGFVVYPRGCTKVTIADNDIDTTILADSVFCIAIALESTDGHSDGICQHVSITGNRLKGFTHAQGIMMHAGSNVAICNNLVQDALMPISVNPFNATDICQHITISGNVVNPATVLAGYSGGNSGIGVQAGGATPDIVDVAITGNVIVNANRADAAPTNQGGIQIGYTRHVTVSGNVISGCGSNGIVLTENEESITIIGNTICDLIEQADGTLNGVLCLGAPTAHIEGNVFRNIVSVAGTGYGMRFNAACSSFIGPNIFENVEASVLGSNNTGLGGRIRNITSGTNCDLDGVDVVYFNHAAPANIDTWSGVIVGKVYTLVFTNNNTTITRANAFLNGSVNQVGTTYDVMQVVGRTATTVQQVAPMSANG